LMAGRQGQGNNVTISVHRLSVCGRLCWTGRG
jgi:hypothetical protein